MFVVVGGMKGEVQLVVWKWEWRGNRKWWWCKKSIMSLAYCRCLRLRICRSSPPTNSNRKGPTQTTNPLIFLSPSNPSTHFSFLTRTRSSEEDHFFQTVCPLSLSFPHLTLAQDNNNKHQKIRHLSLSQLHTLFLLDRRNP